LKRVKTKREREQEKDGHYSCLLVTIFITAQSMQEPIQAADILNGLEAVYTSGIFVDKQCNST
jgi:hypothetical protein